MATNESFDPHKLEDLTPLSSSDTPVDAPFIRKSDWRFIVVSDDAEIAPLGVNTRDPEYPPTNFEDLEQRLGISLEDYAKLSSSEAARVLIEALIPQSTLRTLGHTAISE